MPLFLDDLNESNYRPGEEPLTAVNADGEEVPFVEVADGVKFAYDIDPIRLAVEWDDGEDS